MFAWNAQIWIVNPSPFSGVGLMNFTIYRIVLMTNSIIKLIDIIIWRAWFIVWAQNVGSVLTFYLRVNTLIWWEWVSPSSETLEFEMLLSTALDWVEVAIELLLFSNLCWAFIFSITLLTYHEHNPVWCVGGSSIFLNQWGNRRRAMLSQTSPGFFCYD